MQRILGLFAYHPEKTCPRCGSMHVHRTKRGRILEYWVLFFFSVRPYRCGKCRFRFYGPKKIVDDQDLDDAAEFPAADSAAPSGHRHSQSPRSSRR